MALSPIVLALAAGGVFLLASKKKSAIPSTPNQLITDKPGPLMDVKGKSGTFYQVQVVKMFSPPAGSPPGTVEKFYDVFLKSNNTRVLRFKQIGSPAMYDSGKRVFVVSPLSGHDPILQTALKDFVITTS